MVGRQASTEKGKIRIRDGWMEQHLGQGVASSIKEAEFVTRAPSEQTTLQRQWATTITLSRNLDNVLVSRDGLAHAGPRSGNLVQEALPTAFLGAAFEALRNTIRQSRRRFCVSRSSLQRGSFWHCPA